MRTQSEKRSCWRTQYCQHRWLPDRQTLNESNNVADHDWPGLIPYIRAQEDLQDTPVLQIKWMLVGEVAH